VRIDPLVRLVGTVTTPQELGRDTRDRMFHLMASHFDNVTPDTFERDLDEKRWVVILRDHQSGEVQGFSTMKLMEAIVDGQPIKAVFSGDTIVGRDYWGETELATVWGAFVLSLVEAHRDVRFYWFLISKGFRTYKFLPVYFKSFYPRHDTPTPAFEASLLETLSEQKFPGRFDPATGVIRFDGPKDRLRPELAEVVSGRLNDPHVAYFLAQNPGYAEGDELACVASLAPDNLRPIAQRVVARAQAAVVAE
jgi:hypothetical protein